MLKLYLALSLFALCTASNVTAPKCPPGTVPPENGNETTCYLFVKQSMPFADAESYCQGHNGHLVTVTDAFSDLFIAYQAHDHFPTAASFWIGGHVVNYTCNVWLWTNNNKLLVYSNWKYPPDSGTAPTVGSCAAVTVVDITWSSTPCSQSLPFVCEVPGVAVAATCDAGYQLYPATNMCYKLFYYPQADARHMWNQSEAICNDEGGHLVSIHSVAENIFVAAMAPVQASGDFDYTNMLLLGASVNSQGNYHWTDGSPFDFTNFFANESRTDQCVIMWPGGVESESWELKWDWKGCDDKYAKFVCKKSP